MRNQPQVDNAHKLNQTKDILMKNILPIKAIILGLAVSMTLFGMVGCSEETEATDNTNTEETTDETSDAAAETTEETTDETTDETSEETTEETTDETSETTEETTDETTDETTEETTDETSTEVSEFWGTFCTADAECGAPTDYCVKQPGQSEATALSSAQPALVSDAGADQETWSCNAVFGPVLDSRLHLVWSKGSVSAPLKRCL